MPRSFLVLQGTASTFFSSLAAVLESRGHAVYRVNFCGGDWFYGKTKHAVNYSGAAADLPAWYAALMQRENITDVLMFGDCREVHRPLHPIAEQYGLHVHVFEEGYVRPHWITLESHGVNGRSRMPRIPPSFCACVSIFRPPRPASRPATTSTSASSTTSRTGSPTACWRGGFRTTAATARGTAWSNTPGSRSGR